MNQITQYFDNKDFYCKSVLDLGCNSGQMSKFALDKGAYKVTGIEYDQTAVKSAKELLTDSPGFQIICDDLDNYGAWNDLPMFDTVLFLSVIGSRNYPASILDSSRIPV